MRLESPDKAGQIDIASIHVVHENRHIFVVPYWHIEDEIRPQPLLTDKCAARREGVRGLFVEKDATVKAHAAGAQCPAQHLDAAA